MANIAVILRQMGISVTGSDTEDTQPTDILLTEHGISWSTGFDPDDIPTETKNVVYAASHQGRNNPQVQEAEKRGLTIIHQAPFLGQLISDFHTSVAVCGCHGKTTTSSLLAYALSKLQAHPSWLVGAPSFNEYWGGQYQGSDYFVIEADEYAIDPPRDTTPKLLSLRPTYTLCLNIDYDHPDVYENLDATKHTFETFFHQTQKRIIACAEDANTNHVLQTLSPERYLTYGFDHHNDLVISDIRYDEVHSSFRVTYQGNDRGIFTLSLFGEKNILNAAGVILFLFECGFTSDQIRDAIRYFTGAKRRFELIANEHNIYLFDDYAHHPHELEALIHAARSRFPNHRFIIIFQPHTYTRTAQMKEEFAMVLGKADKALVLPIFGSAREQFQGSISSHDIEKSAQQKNISTISASDSSEELLTQLDHIMQPGDVLCTVGAGDVYKLGDKIVEMMKNKNPNTFEILTSHLGNDRVVQNKNLLPFFTLKTPVTAEYYFEAESKEDWKHVAQVTHKHAIPLFILGGGSNCAILQDQIKGLTVRNQYKKIDIAAEYENCVDLFVSSGCSVSQLIRYTIEHGYAGLEYHFGLPGTVGGAVVMNSKWTRPESYFGDTLVSATILSRKGELKEVDREYLRFSYGYSFMQETKDILLYVIFRLPKEKPEVLQKRAQKALAYRKQTQPQGVATSGCFFKNISEDEQKRLGLPTRSAGYLIDKAGLKGVHVGGFAVSEKHANFIINTGKGTIHDLTQLVSLITQRVSERYGVQLREEVIGNNGHTIKYL